MKNSLIILALASSPNMASEGWFEKTQNFSAVTYGPRDEGCEVVSVDLEKKLAVAEETIQMMGGIIVDEQISPCIYSEEMLSSISGTINYLIPGSEFPVE